MTVYGLGIIRRLGGDRVDGMTEDGAGLHCHVERSRNTSYCHPERSRNTFYCHPERSRGVSPIERKPQCDPSIMRISLLTKCAGYVKITLYSAKLQNINKRDML